ncbi:MAG TPA: malto-oligosyltrehalose trehalohydrolase [Nocardioidaceae bacterium]|jgi:maltooligosyltrehalose trehalohydrolase|nr:malto-oligosyltrehalose trehalohydrolase [Nocardioidaceae bacterium]
MTAGDGREPLTFEVWAPAAQSVDLLLPESRVAMQATTGPGGSGPEGAGREEPGWWRAQVEAGPATTYAFSLDGGDARPDPRGLRLPEGVHGWSQRFDTSGFAWSDDGWTGIELADAVIYELHVGTFTPDGTLDAAAERLDHLVRLGVTLVELLPLAPFPGERGWGYDGVAPYAVHEAYGGPVALQRFVDAAHRRGLGVCLDVVYNHLGPDGNYLAEFGPYLTDRHHTPWGQALNLDAEGSDPVRGWVLDNAAQWLRDFRVDALRLDAVHELHDDRATHLLEELGSLADTLSERLGRPLWLIAESDRNDPRTVTPRGPGAASGGLGLHAQWADDVHHALHVALTGETQGYYADFADPSALPKVLRTPFFHDGTLSTFRGRRHGRPVDPELPGWRFVASLQTHDQVGNRAVGDRLSASLDPGRLAGGATLLLTSPWTPMLFMGEEWGARTPWQYFTDHTSPELAAAVSEGRRGEFAGHGWAAEDVPDPQAETTFTGSKLDWDERCREPHARLLQWYADLLGLRREHPDLRGGRADDVAYHPHRRTVRMRRGPFLVLVNLGDSRHRFDLALDSGAGAPVSAGRTGVVDASAGQVDVLLAWEPVQVHDRQVELPARSAAVVRR